MGETTIIGKVPFRYKKLRYLTGFFGLHWLHLAMVMRKAHKLTIIHDLVLE